MAVSLTRFRGQQILVGGGIRDAEIRTPYLAEVRRKVVDLVRSGRSPDHLAREFEPSAQSICNLVVEADRDDGRCDYGTTTPEREELRRLRRENRRLCEERENLARATAWFARGDGTEGVFRLTRAH